MDNEYEEKRKAAYSNVTKHLFTYAQRVLCLLFREHWVIYWDHIEETLKKASEVTNSYPLKSGVFPIETDDQLLVFDCATSEVFEFSKETKYLFNLIEENGGKQIDVIVRKASKQFNMPEDEMKDKLSEFLSLLIEKSIIFVPELSN